MQQDKALSVCIAGATGWTGRAIAEGALAAPDITLTSAVARRAAGQDLGAALGELRPRHRGGQPVDRRQRSQPLLNAGGWGGPLRHRPILPCGRGR